MAWSSWFWITATRVLNFATLSPLGNGSQQVPLQPALSATGGGPIFKPPANPRDDGTGFRCNYTNMPDWVSCSHPEDRSCWLMNPRTKERFDINTNYEDKVPVGILRQYTVTVEDGWYNADGRNFTLAKMFNGSYPGPWLQACWGDTMEVTVINNMKHNGTSIHWHGIRQFLSTQMDGVNGVTQCAIPPGGRFTYKWKVTQYGSSWYHSHYSVQYADGAVGPITLHGPSSSAYDTAADWPLIVTDWGNNSAFEAIFNGRLDFPSMVINGTGNIENFGGIATLPIPDPYTLTFTPKRKYLLRIINTSFNAAFVFSIDNHILTVIGTEFVPIHPYDTRHITVGIGQRFHVVVTATPRGVPNRQPRNFWIRVNVIKSCEDPGNIIDGLSELVGIVRYQGAPIVDPVSKPWDGVYNHACVDETFENPNINPVVPWFPQRPVNGVEGEHRRVGIIPNGTERPWPLAFWSLKNASMGPGAPWVPLRIDYSDPTFLHLNNTAAPWPTGWVVVPENYTDKDWVYMVLEGGSHPMHLHGHDFAIVQQEHGPFTPVRFRPNTNNPPRRDVIILPRNSNNSQPPAQRVGFAVIAFKTDNPGTWLMHCHIAFHASGGLALQILERQADANNLWPWSTSKAIENARELCDSWNTWYGNCTNWWPGDGSGCVQGAEFQDDSGI